MTTLYESAYAKVNLTLDVLGKRDDGYHDLMSVMQTISLHDDIEIDVGTGKPWKLLCNKPGIPADERNLAWKAAKVFCDTVGFDPNGLEIRITKRIPSEAGLGGGSSDAAAVLRALNRFCAEPMPLAELAELGAKVGSDVPFCTLCGTVMVEGRGERLRKLTNMPECIMVVCKPEFSNSTAQLYRKLDEAEITCRPDHSAMENALTAGNLNMICNCVLNVFDPVVENEHPELARIKAALDNNGALTSQMTGSGSAIFAIFDKADAAASAKELILTECTEAFIAKPV